MNEDKKPKEMLINVPGCLVKLLRAVYHYLAPHFCVMYGYGYLELKDKTNIGQPV